MPPFLLPLQRLSGQLAGRRRAWRRAANLRRAAPRGRWRVPGLPVALVALVAAGGALIAEHARRLGAAVPQPWQAVTALQPYVPGAAFTVPKAGVWLATQGQGALAIVAGMRAAAPVRVDLCQQLRDPGRDNALVPLRLGYGAADVRRWAAAHAPGPRNVVLALAPAAMPQVQVGGVATSHFDDHPLQLTWQGTVPARWLGNGALVTGQRGAGTLARQGWLAWPGGLLHVQRRASAACPAAGELLLRAYRPDEHSDRADVTALGATGSATVTLAPGDYRVPVAAPAALEDAALFEALRRAGLLRLAADGAIAVAPPDLAVWQAAAPAARAAALPQWAGVRLDADGRALLRRLYRQADGAYLRRQVELYNSERALLAWRVAAGAGATWLASGAAGPLAATAALPPAAARLFDTLPQGWQPWSRVARWPAGTGAVQLTWTPPGTAGARVRLLLAGRVTRVEGAAVEMRPACDGRACAARDDVVELVLRPHAGSRAVVVTALPLATDRLQRPGDRRYRHLQVADGRIAWQPLGPAAALPPAPPSGPVTIADRHGTPLWADGRPTRAAEQAGLATLVGLRVEQDSGVAAQLLRAGAGMTGARLTVDLPLQALANQVLACVGMRRGTWDGRRCTGGAAPPAGREAGIVLLDSENGDILAAAGFGAGRASGADWAELRDFDRADPARSPLRLPALQHDGGARRSPGSTFKIVSALGLELAARDDARLDALLAGVPLARLDALAHERGFDFASGAASYPAHAEVHVTNYRELGLAGRVQDGRLGLAQALTYSLNTWFAWTGELSDVTLFGRADGGVPAAQALQPGALDAVRPILAAARRLGFEQPLRLDGGLLPAGFDWHRYDALQATPAQVDPIRNRHELRQMSIGLRMQATPLQMAMAAGAIGQGATVAPRLLAQLDGRAARTAPAAPLDVRLDRIRAGMKGVIERGTAATAFRCGGCAPLRAGLYGKTGTAPVGGDATVWFTGWLEPGTLPGQRHRLAFAVFISRSEAGGGDHAAPVLAALLATLAEPRTEGQTAMLIGQ